MVMLDGMLGELPDAIGNVLSPAIKLTMTGFGIVFTVAMALKYKHKRRENPDDPSIVRRNMTLLLAFYTAAALLASFDVLLGWRDMPYKNAYSGIAFSLVFTAVANGFYFWFVLQVLYVATELSRKKQLILILFVIIEIGTTTTSFLLKMAANGVYLLLLLIHVGATGLVFMLVLLKAVTLGQRSFNEEYRKKFNAIWIGSCFCLASLVLFAIDAFSTHVTIYSIIGWLSLLCMSFFLWRGYY